MTIFSLLVSVVLIMYLINKKYPMGAVIFLGALVLGILAGLSPKTIAGIIFQTVITPNTLELVFSVYLIGLLGSMMQGYGVIEKMMEYLEKTFKSVKLLLFIVPSLLSTFSVAGSAVFAAPVIDVLGDKIGISKERKAAINLYIRHAWYFVLPISPSLLYAAYLIDVSIWDLIKVQAPLAVVTLIVSYLVYIAPLKDVRLHSNNGEKRTVVLKSMFFYTGPISLTLILVIWLPFYIALIAGCVLSFLIRTRSGNFADMLRNKQGLNMVYAAAAIMIFKGVIDGLPGIRLFIQGIIEKGMTIEALLLILPLIMGYVLANPQALIGMLFPILLPLVPSEQVLAAAAAINIMGYVTYYVSPLHLCQALTNEYFCVSTKDLYREYKITVPVMFIAGLINYLFWM